MVADGWTGGIVNVDYSEVVIAQMKERCTRFVSSFESRTQPPSRASKSKQVQGENSDGLLLDFVCSDVTKKLPFQDNSFDLIICKATLDAILAGKGAIADVRLMMTECHRLLRDNHGSMVVVSHGNPESRMVRFENEGDQWWDSVAINSIPTRRTERSHLIESEVSPK